MADRSTPDRKTPDRAADISSVERSAFWIYGFTAMLMREPFGSVLKHASAEGLNDWQVRLEILRVATVLLLMSRLFLAAGLYFERVFMGPDSATRFPRRSYPVDFLSGLGQLLLVAAASTITGLHARLGHEVSLFAILLGVFLLSEVAKLGLALFLGHSSVPVIARLAKYSTLTFAVSAAGWAIARSAGADPVFGEQVALVLLFGFTAWDVPRLIAYYAR